MERRGKGMVTWSKHLYIGEGMEKKLARTKKKIERGKFVHGIFLITEPSNSANLFDILDAKELLFSYYKRHSRVVYGVAKGKEDAIQVVLRMLEDMYRETGEFKVREYFVKE